MEHAGDFEWRGEGEGAEVVLYAPDDGVADAAFERVLPAARLPGVTSPVYAAASPLGSGWVASSATHAAPDLISAPERGVLLVAGVAVENLGMPPEDVPRLLSRDLSEVRLPALNEAGVGRICEAGARGAAEDGLVEEEDLAFFGSEAGEADSLGRRAVAAGTRDWDRLGEVRAYAVGEVLDAEGAGGLDLGPGSLALVVRVGSGDLGRLALDGHRGRILSRARSGDFGAEADPPAAPLDTGEAADLLAAVRAAANFADGRTALLVYALRRALGGVFGELRPRASWVVGGFEEPDGLLVHRRGLAAVGDGEALASGDGVAAATGMMSGSAPPFGALESDGRAPWEEAGLLERWAALDALGA